MSKTRGYLFAGIAIFGFSATFIGIALASQGFSPTIVAIGRIIPAGIGAVIALKLNGQPLLPPREIWNKIWLVAFGLILGFPIFSTLAMQTIPASDAGVIVAIAPIFSALVAIAIFNHQKPRPAFWIAAATGTVSAMIFSLSRSSGFGGGELWGYHIMVVAVVFGALGNVSAATLAAKFNAFYVISWAIVISIPFLLPVTIFELVSNPIRQMPGAMAWAGFLFVSLFSIFIGHYFFSNALHVIGIVKASQLQLVQPISTLLLAIFILGDTVSWLTWLAAFSILLCVSWSQRIRSNTVITNEK